MGPQSEQRMGHLRRKLENEFLVLDILNMYVPLGRSGGGGLVVVAMSGEGGSDICLVFPLFRSGQKIV